MRKKKNAQVWRRQGILRIRSGDIKGGKTNEFIGDLSRVIKTIARFEKGHLKKSQPIQRISYVQK